MNFEAKYMFLKDTLKKCHIHTSVISVKDTADAMIDPFLASIIGNKTISKTTVESIIGVVQEKVKYHFVNEMKLHFMFIPMSIPDSKSILSIGPYVNSNMSTNEILEIGEKLGFAPTTQRYMQEYYSTLPIIAENDRLHMMIDTFCEQMWQTPSFAMVEINKGHTLTFSTVDQISRSEDFNETLAEIERMELRYSLENEMIQAVTLGQQHKDKLLMSAFTEKMFERRVQDPVRNAKNYCIIMNTLMRKAAENGGVHPLYIDRLSSKIAIKIEQVSNIKAVPELMKEIFSSYCRLVRKHATNKYSNVVKNTILMIESDISAELSLHDLAKRQSITSEYLATVFKKETGKTVIEYIRDKRINHAVHLLNTTNLQIQTVAMHCGINDVQYFSKIFKKQIGKTPREYREHIRK